LACQRAGTDKGEGGGGETHPPGRGRSVVHGRGITRKKTAKQVHGSEISKSIVIPRF
jgi:hypothetical protein